MADMSLTSLSLNLLRAFDAAARHLNLTRAAEELRVTQAAVSHQVKALEQQLGIALFRRARRGLVLTDEGAALAPKVRRSLAELASALDGFAARAPREVVTVSAVGSFAVGFLIERLKGLRARHPQLDVRLTTNNNRVDHWGESLDFAIQFGDGAWRALEATQLFRAPMSALCAPAVARGLAAPADLATVPLLRSYRAHEWDAWSGAAAIAPLNAQGAMFDSSIVMVQAAILGEGVALAPPVLFARELREGRLAQPFPISVDVGAYWLTRVMAKEKTLGMQLFQDWLLEQCAPFAGQA
jgi:LysR family transcriptional regulator, regulator of gene expression of beta-lactamase